MLKEFHGEHILRAVSLLSSGHKRFKGQYLELAKKNEPGLGVMVEKGELELAGLQTAVLRRYAREFNLVAVDAAAERVSETLKNFPKTAAYGVDLMGMLVSALEILINVTPDAMRGQSIYLLTSNSARYLTEGQYPFGQDVADNFSSAEYDISEASKCMAFERWTACVMHLMRVLEVGLGSLAKSFDLDPNENWNTLLNQIEAKLKEVGKKTHGADEEQFAAEAATHFRSIKNAWRNHAMHARETYDEERAVAIYDSVRSFMRHLSTRLQE